MSRSRIILILSLALAGTISINSRAQQAPRAAAPQSAQTLPPTYRWRSVGPERGGRSIAISGVKGRPREGYFGATGGGLWKTTDGGENWTPVTDGQVKSSSVGAVAVSETNPDLVFIGMGESGIRGNIPPGDGVCKSTDGGKTWQRKLFRDAKTGAVDISIDRRDPNVMYAALWEAYRVEYQMSSGGAVQANRRRQDDGELRRRRLPRSVDRSRRQPAHAARERQRRRGDVQRRRPAAHMDGARFSDGPVLPRGDDQTRPVPRVRRPAGRQHDLHPERDEPRRRRAWIRRRWRTRRRAGHLRSRRIGAGPHRARPEGSRHLLFPRHQ